MDNWYYVENNDKVGPVSYDALRDLIMSGPLDEDSYVWKSGFQDWKKISEVDELIVVLHEVVSSVDESVKNDDVEVTQTIEMSDFLNNEDEDSELEVDETVVESNFDWKGIDLDSSIFSIKVGVDRGENETEYGPFSLNFLKRLLSENRISHKTYVFSPGMETWIFIADMPIYEEVFLGIPPVIDEVERRRSVRRPFVAKLLFHDNEKIFEGICRDISTGGVQILVADSPVNVGDEISLNVHPDNTDFSFVAKGKVVRNFSTKKGFSIRFTELSDVAINAIESCINE